MATTIKTRAELNYEERDPNKLHEEMKVDFEEIFGEPGPDVHSVNCVWGLAYTCFSMCKLWVYKLLSLCCGICVACKWGCCFAYYAFCMIWIYTPFLKCYGFLVALWKKQCLHMLDCVVGPFKDCLIDFCLRCKGMPAEAPKA